MPPRRKRAAAPARRSARFAEQDAANEKAQEHANRTYEIGDRVEARWDGRPEWFPGRVIAMNDDETYDILYDDGEDELNVKPALMKREPPRKRKTVNYGDMMDSGDGVPQRRSQRAFCRFGFVLIVSFTQMTTRSPSSSPWRTSCAKKRPESRAPRSPRATSS